MGLSGQGQTSIRVLLVDRYVRPRRALRQALDSEPTLSVVGETDNALHALQLTHRLQPDIVLMEASMPVMSGFEASRVLKQEWPCVQVILMSAIYSRAEIESEARRRGAAMFWNKMSNAFTDLIPSIGQLCRPLGRAP